MIGDSENEESEIDAGCEVVFPPAIILNTFNSRTYPARQLCKACKKSLLSIHNKYDVCRLCIDKRLAYYNTQLNCWSDRKIIKRVLQDLDVNVRKPIKKKTKDPRSVWWNA